HAVRRGGTEGVVFRGRQDVRIPVSRTTGRGVDDATNTGVPTRFEQGDRSQYVDARVEARVRHRPGDRGLGGDVDDGFGPRRGDDVVEPRIAEVAHVETGGGVDPLAPSRGEAVEPAPRVRARRPAVQAGMADEA